MKKMRILGIDSSAKSASAAYVKDETLVASYFQNSGLTHSKTLLPMIEDMLKNNGIMADDIDMFAVSHGPGSFTGLRIGISTVKGMAFSKNMPAVGVSTLEATAYSAPQMDAVLCVVMDARAGQVYAALFDLSEAFPVRITKDRAVRIDDLKRELLEIEKPVYFAGDGVHLFDTAINIVPENLRLPNAFGVCRLARRVYSAGGSEFSPADLKPEYLRLPQAERERLAKIQGAAK